MRFSRCLAGLLAVTLITTLLQAVPAAPARAASAPISYAYDAAGRLVGVTDPDSDTARYSYDAVGNLISISRFASTAVSVLSLTPDHGAVGAQVTISGTGFSPTSASNTISFNGTMATVVSASATRLVVTVPGGAGSGAVSVTSPGGSASSPTAFTVDPTPATPVISTLSATSGTVGASVTVSGSGFDPTPGRDIVVFGRTRARVSAASATSLTVAVPDGFGAGHVSVKTPAGVATGGDDFVVVPAPYTPADIVSTNRVAIGGASVTVTVATASVNKAAMLLFDGSAGQVLSVGFTAATMSSAITVYDPYGQQLPMVPPPGGTGNGSLRLPPLPSSGTYQAIIDPSGSATGSATVSLSAATAAGTLSPGGAGSTVTLGARPGQGAELTFAGTSGQHVSVALTASTYSDSLHVAVIQPAGSILLNDQALVSPNGVDLVPLPFSGTYRVIVTPPSNATGSGSVTVTLSQDLDGGTLTTTSAPTAVSIARPGQNARFRFAGTAGQRLSLGLTSPSFTGTAFFVSVFTSDGALVVQNAQFSGQGGLDLPSLPQTGTYEATISPDRAGTGSVTVTLSQELDGGTLTTTGAGVTLSIARAGQNARLRFSGSAGLRLSLGFTGNSLSGTFFNLSVFNPDGTALLDNQLGSSSVDLPHAPAAGTYEVVVNPQSAGTGGLTVTLSQEVDGGTLATTGAGVTVAIVRAGQNARLRFSGTAGQRLSLGFTGNTLSGSLHGFSAAVLRPDGTSLTSQSLTGSADVDLVALPTTGTYELVVNPDSAGTGSLTVTLSQEQDAGTLTTTAAGTSLSFGRVGQNLRLHFAGTTGQRLSLGFTGNTLSGSLHAFRVSVLRPDGTALVNQNSLDGTANALDLAALAVTGTYDVVINPSEAGTGSMTVTLSEEIDGGTLTVGGAGRATTISRPGQNARYSFAGTSGQTLTLTFSGVTIPGSYTVTALKPDSTTLTTFSGVSGNTTRNLPALPASGTYQVVINPASAATGAITVAVSLTGAGPVARGQVRPQGLPTPPHRAPVTTAASAAAAVRAALVSTGSWRPDAVNLRGTDWFAHTPPELNGQLPPPRAARGVTALAGQVRTFDGQPLAHVALSVGRVRTTTDPSGRFLLTRLPAGHQVLRIDGHPASRQGRAFGIFQVGVELVGGRTTELGYTIWMPVLDTEHTVRISAPTTHETVLTTPAIPGLEVHIPTGSTIRNRDGKAVRELGITAIPVDRPPFPLPSGVHVPVYFTVQPGGAYVLPDGARIIYPNYAGLAAGTRVDFWSYDPDRAGWHVYGKGTVTGDGRQVVPDPGVRIWEFTGAMISNGRIAAALAPVKDFFNWLGGDPVDLGTGLLVNSHTDLALPDTLPIALTRTWRQADTQRREFGLGQNFSYGLFLQETDPSGSELFKDVQLVLPDSGTIRFHRISAGSGFADAVFQADPTPTAFHRSVMAWNGHGWDLTLRDGTIYVMGENAPLQAIRDRHGNKLTVNRGFAAGPNGPISQITSPNGKWIKLTYGTSGITQAQDNTGRTVAYDYDSAGRLQNVTDPASHTTTYGYNAANQLTTVRDPRNITYLTNTYDTAGRVQTQSFPDGASFQFDYTTDPAGKITETRVTDPRGHVRRVQFNAQGFATSDTQALGTTLEQTTTLARQPVSNFLASVTDPRGRTTSFAYDGLGNPTGVTRLAGTPNAVTSTAAYDGPLNQLSSVTDPLSHTTTFGYDPAGNLATVNDPLTRATTLAVNPDGQLGSVTDNLSHTTSFTYQLGDLVAVTDPLSRTARQFADAAGRVVEVADPAGGTGTVSYDQLNQITGSTDPLGHTTTFTYDSNGNPETVTDARHNTTTYVYDDLDRVETVTDPLGNAASYGYDENGNITEATSRRGKVSRLTYDALDRLSLAEYGVSGTSSESTTSVTHDNADRPTQLDDSAGGVVSLGYDELDRLTSQTTPQGTVSYTYDAAGRRATMTVAGQPQLIYGYNTADQLTSISQSGTTQVSLGYDAAGRRSTLTLPGGVSVSYGFDNASQLTSLTNQRGTTALGDLAYTYDPAGRRATVSGAFARTGIPDPVGSTAYNANNQLTSRDGATFSYDPDGNLTGDGTTTYTWNTRGQLADLSRPGLTGSFGYDGLGRRTIKTINGATTGFLYDGANPIQELSGATPTANLLTGGTDEYFARTDTAGGRSFLTDALGSTVALADSAGTLQTQYTYDPFGTTTATGAASGNGMQYTGRENDGTGLYYYRARYYSSTLGRFLSEDPIGVGGGDANLYAYAANSPTNLTDPSGNNPLLVGCAVGALLNGGIDYLAQRLSGRKVDWGWGGVGGAALQGCALGLLGEGLAAAGGKFLRAAGADLLAGSGPGRGVLEVSSRVKSTAAFRNLNPATPRNFIFDPDTQRLLVGRTAKGYGHPGLARLIGANEDTVVGGELSRGLNGQFLTNEASGHYGVNWTDNVRQQFIDFMQSFNFEIRHTPWGQ